MLGLTITAGSLVGQSPKAKPAPGSTLLFWFLLTPPRLTVWIQLTRDFSVCLFFVFYSLSYKTFLPFSHFAVLRLETVHFMKCLYHQNYLNYFFNTIKKLLCCCSITVVCIPPPPPSQTHLPPYFHPPPWFWPCVLYSSSWKPFPSLSLPLPLWLLSKCS